VNLALEQFAQDVMTRCADARIAKGLYYVDPAKIAVRCDLRGKSRAGLAHPGEMWIRLSPAYFAAIGEGYANTVAHEYAHIVERLEARERGIRRSPAHGLRWRAVMRSMGYDPSRCLTDAERALSASVQYARKVPRFAYRCAAGHEHVFGKVRHARALRGSTWLCATAGCKYRATPDRRLAFTGEVRT
jgi:predicted SprT family Zn-dependent metalloprotease